MRVLITGGAGFIGSNLAIAVKHALPAATVVCMDNLYRRGSELNVPRLQADGVEFFRGDIRNLEAFPSRPFDFLIECSAEPSVLAGHDGSPDYLFQTNLVGTYHCLEKARAWHSRLLFLSTSRVYPIARLEAHPWREESTRFVWEDCGTPGITSRGVTEDVDMGGPRSLYGCTKYAAELLIQEYRAAYGLAAVVNRCGVIAGPWQFGKVDQGVAAFWVMAHHFGRSLSYIGYGGNGKQVRDIIHIADLCDLLIEQMTNFDAWEGWSGNVTGGLENSASLCELTRHCEEVVGRRIAISSNPANRPSDLRLFIGDSSRLFARTHWRARHTVRDMVTDIHKWVCANERAVESLN